MLTSLNTQLEAATQQLSQMQQNRSYAEAMLAAQSREAPTVSGTTQVAPLAQETQLQTLLTEEADLTSRYNRRLSDVVMIRRKIQELRAQMAKPQPAGASSSCDCRPQPTGADEYRSTACSNSLDGRDDCAEGAGAGTDPGAGADLSGPRLLQSDGAGTIQKRDARLSDGAGFLSGTC